MFRGWGSGVEPMLIGLARGPERLPVCVHAYACVRVALARGRVRVACVCRRAWLATHPQTP